jgi:hypothetical protein
MYWEGRGPEELGELGIECGEDVQKREQSLGIVYREGYKLVLWFSHPRGGSVDERTGTDQALTMHTAQAVIKRCVRWRREKTGNAIFGQSFSSLACSYSVSMLSAALKQSVGCETSKSDDSDMARTEKRWVLCEGHAGPAIISHQYNPSDQ